MIFCKLLSLEYIKKNDYLIDDFYKLMEMHYENIKFEKFLADLNEKDEVFVIYEDSLVRGFSTIKKIKLEIDSDVIIGIFSGDTIIEKGYSWSMEFQKEWIKYCLKEREKNKQNNIKTYWFLISKGIKTYMYLPLYFNKFYPNKNENATEIEIKIIDKYATLLYEERYVKEKGIIKNNGNNDHLKEDIIVLSEKKKENEDIKYFVNKNPGYLYGDELVCLTEISEENLTKFGKRVIKNMFL